MGQRWLSADFLESGLLLRIGISRYGHILFEGL